MRHSSDTSVGINQWFHHEDERLDDFVRRSIELGIREIRTGIFWADYHRPDGRQWYRHMFDELKRIPRVEILASVWSVPPSLSESGRTNGPVREGDDENGVPHWTYYANDIREMCETYGDAIDALELWNEPNNEMKWDFNRPLRDGQPERWRIFDKMIPLAAELAKERGMHTVLGGMSPVDHAWLRDRFEAGVLDRVDGVGFHCFPGMPKDDERRINWDWRFTTWDERVGYMRNCSRGKELWATEVGCASSNLEGVSVPEQEREQARRLIEAARMFHRSKHLKRMYWYSFYDLPRAWECVEKSVADKDEPHAHNMGLITEDGREKHAYGVLSEMLRTDRGKRAEEPLSHARRP